MFLVLEAYQFETNIQADETEFEFGHPQSMVIAVDLGTNEEIFVGNRLQLLFASTADCPAFEGARISMACLRQLVPFHL